MTTETVTGPKGTFVVRTERRGVPIRTTMNWPTKDLYNRARRLLRRDRAWLVHVQRSADDPFGPDVYTVVVQDKTGLDAVLEQVRDAVRTGRLG